jgi:hypothetical protein
MLEEVSKIPEVNLHEKTGKIPVQFDFGLETGCIRADNLLFSGLWVVQFEMCPWKRVDWSSPFFKKK